MLVQFLCLPSSCSYSTTSILSPPPSFLGLCCNEARSSWLSLSSMSSLVILPSSTCEGIVGQRHQCWELSAWMNNKHWWWWFKKLRSRRNIVGRCQIFNMLKSLGKHTHLHVLEFDMSIVTHRHLPFDVCPCMS